MNLVFLITFSQDWNQFYDYHYDLEIYISNNRIIDEPRNHRIHVHESHFKDLTSKAIYIFTESNDSLLFVDLCSFSNIFPMAINYVQSGQMCIYRTCGIKCYSDEYGNYSSFLNIAVSNSSQYQNILNLSSIALCGLEYACILACGYQQISQTNFSNCNRSIFVYESQNQSFIRYSTIAKSSSSSFDRSNILYSYGDMDVSRCIFNDDKGYFFFLWLSINHGNLDFRECVFSQINMKCLFVLSDSHITVINCFFDKENSIYTTFDTNVNGTIINPVGSLDIKLKLLNSHSCLESISHHNMKPCTNCIINLYRLKFMRER